MKKWMCLCVALLLVFNVAAEEKTKEQLERDAQELVWEKARQSEALSEFMAYGYGIVLGIQGSGNVVDVGEVEAPNATTGKLPMIKEIIRQFEIRWLVNEDRERLLSDLYVRHPDFHLPNGPAIDGASRDELKASFGVPMQEQEDFINFNVPVAGPTDSSLVFYFNDGKVSGMRWQWGIE